MAVIALVSAKGAPGVTTTALGLTLSWPRPVLMIEADVRGGSSVLAGWLRATVPHDRSLVDAAIAHHNGRLAEELPNYTIPLPPDDLESPRRLLPATPRADQRAPLTPLWAPLARLASQLGADTGTDVIIDGGQLWVDQGPKALLHGADAVLLVTRADLPAVTAAWAAIGPLKAELAATGGGIGSLALLLIGGRSHGPAASTYSVREVRDALDTTVLGRVAHDPAAAAVLHRGESVRRFERSDLMRSLGPVADAAIHLAARRASLRPNAAPSSSPSPSTAGSTSSAPSGYGALQAGTSGDGVQ